MFGIRRCYYRMFAFPQAGKEGTRVDPQYATLVNQEGSFLTRSRYWARIRAQQMITKMYTKLKAEFPNIGNLHIKIWIKPKRPVEKALYGDLGVVVEGQFAYNGDTVTTVE